MWKYQVDYTIGCTLQHLHTIEGHCNNLLRLINHNFDRKEVDRCQRQQLLGNFCSDQLDVLEKYGVITNTFYVRDCVSVRFFHLRNTSELLATCIIKNDQTSTLTLDQITF